MRKEELLEIRGGASLWNATYVNAIIRGAQFIFNVGQSIGSAIIRGIRHSYC